jgi:hypothetical protein
MRIQHRYAEKAEIRGLSPVAAKPAETGCPTPTADSAHEALPIA